MFLKAPCTCARRSPVSTCFEGELVLFLAVVVVERTHADPFAGAGVIFKRVAVAAVAAVGAVAAVLVAGVGGGLLVVGPLGGVGLVFVVAAHAEGATQNAGKGDGNETKSDTGFPPTDFTSSYTASIKKKSSLLLLQVSLKLCILLLSYSLSLL